MDASTPYFQETVNLDIYDKDVHAEVSLSEAGNIDVEVINSPQFGVSSEFSENIGAIGGTTLDGDGVEFSNVIVSLGLQSSRNKASHRYISSLSPPSEIEIDGSGGYVSYEGEEVSVQFDVLGFKPFIPHNAVDEIELINRDSWQVTASSVNEIDERIDFIKSHKTLLRTAEVVVTLDIPGCISHQVDQAREKLSDVLSLAGFVQGMGPNFVRGEVISINGEPPDTVDNGIRFTKMWSTQGDIGGAFKSERLVWGNEFPQYLDVAYDNYDSYVQDELQLRHVLGYYWDALNSTRPVEGRYLSVCSAIELLAKRYSDLFKQQSRTQDRIEYLVDELEVETDDLTDFAGTSDRAVSSTYFYSYSRQYVVHGDNNLTWSELRDDFEAALTLLQRIIRNQLVGPVEEESGFNELVDISPKGVVEFE
ncbi:MULTISPECIES: hypothetical protein [Halorubrum]|uniref:hypothetical protein n=1 Tax=Halorubrum TaxID=56688 RepID=UPI0012677A46|nr:MULTISPECIES: hypothetical protein [Halorubrum]